MIKTILSLIVSVILLNHGTTSANSTGLAVMVTLTLIVVCLWGLVTVSRRRDDNHSKSRATTQNRTVTYPIPVPAASKPVNKEEAFSNWLIARGYDAVPLPPEQLAELRRQFESGWESGG